MASKRLKIWRVAWDAWEQRFEEDFRKIPGMPADAVLVASSIHAYMVNGIVFDIALKIHSDEFEAVPTGALVPVNEEFRNADTPLIRG